MYIHVFTHLIGQVIDYTVKKNHPTLNTDSGFRLYFWIFSMLYGKILYIDGEKTIEFKSTYFYLCADVDVFCLDVGFGLLFKGVVGLHPEF